MTKNPETGNAPRVIVVGQTFEASRTVQRVAAMRALGHPVTPVATTPAGYDYETPATLLQKIRYRIRYPADPAGANQAILQGVARGADILWLDGADMISPATLRRARQINNQLAIVWYCEDDMMNKRFRTRQLDGSLSLFDLWVTTKSFNAQPGELPSLGVKKTFFVNNSSDPAIHRPLQISEEDQIKFGSSISFIGSFEEPRADSLLHLARSGLKVRVWGNGWAGWVGRHPDLEIENKPAYNDDFAKVVAASSINLCFLRKSNRDLQTCRSVEIPSCSGFMVHERNSEISALYREGTEAVYFSTNDELATVCRSWLSHDQQRSKVGTAARDRTLELKLVHRSNITRILDALPRHKIAENS